MRAFQPVWDNQPYIAGDQRAGRPVLAADRAAESETRQLAYEAATASPWVEASATGFGPGRARAPYKPGASDELTIHLVEDGPPIDGRIIDLEGRPVAGARVEVERLWFAESDDLSTHIEEEPGAAPSGASGTALTRLPTTIATTTDADGRFHLTGIGRERVAEFLVSGPAIATTVLYAMNRNGPEGHDCIDRMARAHAGRLPRPPVRVRRRAGQAHRGRRTRQGYRSTHRCV